MSSPTKGAQKLLIHMASYLKGIKYRMMVLDTPVVGQGFIARAPKEGQRLVEGFADADWSGCKQTRKSVSGTVVLWNNLTVTSSSRTQKAIALSTAESEFNAAISTACDLLYLRNCINFLVGEAEVCTRLLGDSSACRGVIARQGAGRIKHLSGKLLWIQNKNQTGEIVCCAVGTVWNVADMMTKALSRPRINLLLHFLGACDEDGFEIGQHEAEEQEEKLHLKSVIRRVQRDVQDLGISAGTKSMTLAKSLLRIGVASNLLIRGAGADANDNSDDALSTSPISRTYEDGVLICAFVGAIYICTWICRAVQFIFLRLRGFTIAASADVVESAERKKHDEGKPEVREKKAKQDTVDASVNTNDTSKMRWREAASSSSELPARREIPDPPISVAPRVTSRRTSMREETVTLTISGRCYHRSSCKWLEHSTDLRQCGISYAIQHGLKRCSTCYGGNL